MNAWEKLERIIDAWGSAGHNACVGIKKDAGSFRAIMVGLFDGGTNPIQTTCYPTPAQAVEAMYEIVLERTWKKFRPIESEFRALGLTVPEPVLPNSEGRDGT